MPKAEHVIGKRSVGSAFLLFINNYSPGKIINFNKVRIIIIKVIGSINGIREIKDKKRLVKC
ncbi:hypothetical protein LXJ15735_08130 [Lacrimispora xylanolytica]